MQFTYADGNLGREAYLKRCGELKKQLDIASEPAPEPELDLERAVELLASIGRLLERATLGERRNLIAMLGGLSRVVQKD